MQTISRREFLYGSTVSLALASMQLQANPLGMPVGCQTYPLRESIGKDFDGTLKQIAGGGFKMIEMCSPMGYEKAGYGPLEQLKPSELRAKIHAAGLGCVSCHFNYHELQDHIDDRIAYAKELGLKQMIVATLGVKRDATMADWMEGAEGLNKLGEKTHAAGIQLGYHNHTFEFHKLDGVLIYDELMKKLDPKMVKMQFQMSVFALGFNPADYLAKYPGRFISLHLQDGTLDQRPEVAIGQGTMDWKKIFTAAKAGGIKNYFVEMKWDAMAASVPYLQKLKV